MIARQALRLEKWRLYKSRGFAWLAAFFLLCYPFAEARMLGVENRRVESARISPALSGFRIVFVSDIHWGQWLSSARVDALCGKINALQPDLILLGRDYAEDSDGAIAFFERLPSLKARLGVAAVPGNHDRTLPESNYALLERAMIGAGIRPLFNRAWSPVEGLVICGVDDVHNGHPDFEGALAQADPADYTVLLCHSPAALPQALAYGRFDLTLSGHTHGGQFGIWRTHPEVPERFQRGWNKEGGAWTLTSNGVGVSYFPMRIGATPQLHVITLEQDTEIPRGNGQGFSTKA
ncbi:MAG TPA: metallophosphoesterase, partial [Clostridia bacterium]|nr:metallophosphoesterase [Clostridia bacterium]